MFEEDLTPFFDTDDFAVAATYTPSGGLAKTVNVIFDNAALDRLGIVATNPVALCRAEDVSAPTGADTLVVNGTTYKIKDADEQDDGATTLLQLEKQ